MPALAGNGCRRAGRGTAIATPGAMNHTSTIAVVLLVSAIFAGSMIHARAARPSVERSADVSASRGDADDGANQGTGQIWAAATAD